MPLWALGRILGREPFSLGGSLAARFGFLYIQDQSSMLPPLALAPTSGSVVLDMCASPGGKTGMLAQMVGPEGLVVANEPNRTRMVTLQANMRRMSHLNVVCSSYPGESIPLLDGRWPFILCDVPCSGWGTESRHPGIRELWPAEKTTVLRVLQRRILARAAALLAPGGRLVYSTCTTNPEENERQVEWAVAELGLEGCEVPVFQGVVGRSDPQLGTLTVDGQASGSQGFFVALLGKKTCAVIDADSRPQTRARSAADETRGLGPGIVLPPGDTVIDQGRVFFRPGPALDVLPGPYKWKGTLLGRMTGSGLAPASCLRTLLPGSMEEGVLLDELEGVRALLSGSSLPCGPKTPAFPGLYWRGLGLAWLQRKGRRCLIGP
ncbi:MAG: RsmB/NOP family class I SAM-dependent RNA methyltransferase [Deltaproteobacteria bacterium]|nr:RsmB/NOP family class I SAM-dependent RNA methyltransferase [Deltaproteobacteria bacterium]